MRDNLVRYFLIISLLLNVSVLGAAAYTRYRGTPHETAPRYSDTHANHVFKQLSLKPAEREAMQQKASTFHLALNTKRQEVLAKKAILLRLMRADAPDNREIDQVISQINKGQEEMQKMIVAHILEFKGMLAKDQQQKFLDLIEEAMAGRNPMQCPQ
jgi:hypothetical protein